MPRIGLAVALALLAGIALAATGCTSTSGSLPDADVVEEDADLPPPEDIVSGLGTVRYVQLEGGFYGIVADDSTRYLPQDLGTDYREDGLRVRFRAAVQDSAMTMEMWGTPVEMLDILRVEDGSQ
ncbi:MAG: hypothetical protein BRD38_04875 [Bacteroidetes bacterium QH_9_67_14]|nr:MAG: hypothetical protein BRD38_04875 [Bacteroidetes bacterium QH_9_67_14]